MASPRGGKGRATAAILAVALAIAGASFLLRQGRGPRPSPRRAVEARPPEEAGAVPPGEDSRPAPRPDRTPGPPPSAPAPTGAPELPPAQAASETTLVRGRVSVLGTPPRPRRVRMDASPDCAALHPEPPWREDAAVDPRGGLQWAFVFVDRSAGAPPVPVPTSEITIDQKGCRFTPHVLGIRVCQALTIRNRDPLLHSVHAVTFQNREFSVGQPIPGSTYTHRFERTEVMVHLRCDIHPWMEAWIGVLDHPWFAVTDAAGTYRLPPLAPGRYTLRVWHERYASQSREIDLGGGGEAVEDFALDEKRP